MRRQGLIVVLIGLAALGSVAVDSIRTPASAHSDQETARHQVIAVQRVIGWAAIVGITALATLAGGLGELIMSRPDRNPMGPPRKPNGDIAAMIDAEVNEGGPPSPIPCDTPVQDPASDEAHHFMSEKPATIETCPAPDRVLHLPLGEAVGTARSATLMKSDGLELIRLAIPAGKEIPPHRAPGEITVQCLEGLVVFEHDGDGIVLRPGDLLHLCPQETHALKGIADSSVLVTRLRPHANELPEKFPEL